VPLQSVVVGGHWQLPAEHCLPPLQALPQVPQLLDAVWTLTHAPLQSVSPFGHMQAPAEHDVPPLQTMPHPPQF